MGRREERPENQPVTVPGPGGFVNQFREAADVGGLARDLPRSGGRECRARAKRGGTTSGATSGTGGLHGGTALLHTTLGDV